MDTKRKNQKQKNTLKTAPSEKEERGNAPITAPSAPVVIDQETILAGICYGLFPPLAVSLSILMLILKRKSTFIRFHAKQGLVFGIVGLILMLIPFVNIITNFVIFPIVAVIAFLKAVRGEEWNMPFIEKFAKKLKF